MISTLFEIELIHIHQSTPWGLLLFHSSLLRFFWEGGFLLRGLVSQRVQSTEMVYLTLTHNSFGWGMGDGGGDATSRIAGFDGVGEGGLVEKHSIMHGLESQADSFIPCQSYASLILIHVMNNESLSRWTVDHDLASSIEYGRALQLVGRQIITIHQDRDRDRDGESLVKVTVDRVRPG